MNADLCLADLIDSFGNIGNIIGSGKIDAIVFNSNDLLRRCIFVRCAIIGCASGFGGRISCCGRSGRLRAACTGGAVFAVAAAGKNR